MSRFFLGITGASGHSVSQNFIRALVELEHEVHVCLTSAGSLVMAHEMGWQVGENGEGLADVIPEWIGEGADGRVHCYDPRDVGGKPASGTAQIEATILVPCSMGTMARVAAGFSSNLVERAADVALKEGRTLMIMPRETPLSRVHLKNMLSLAEMGTVILPCMPGWYHNPKTLQDLLDHGVGKALDRLGVEHRLGKRWAGLKELPTEAGIEPPQAMGGDS
ncbi:MAG: UbiX family flavin prenyltransferase, partial [Planctomycetota bacterium]|nr:UbiX family flavin prenyltransferase [Planctomycetota bacterium]